jgi:hypothetical protein
MRRHTCGRNARGACIECVKLTSRAWKKTDKGKAQRKKDYNISKVKAPEKWAYKNLTAEQKKAQVDSQRERNLKIKIQVLTHYSGGSSPYCKCCGEQEIVFLQLDHVNRDGAEHRRELKKQGKLSGFYAMLVREDFPNDYDLQVLCCNCNFATRFGLACPHQK